MTFESGVYANEAESAIKLSVRPNYAPQTTHTRCGRSTPRCTVGGESSGAASSETPQCAIMGECTAAGKTAWQGGRCVPGTSPADQAQAASRQCIPQQPQVKPVGPKTAAQDLTHGNDGPLKKETCSDSTKMSGQTKLEQKVGTKSAPFVPQHTCANLSRALGSTPAGTKSAPSKPVRGGRR